MDTEMKQRETEEFEEILRRNPRVDSESVRKGLALVRELRDAGITERGYNLSNPYARIVHRSSDTDWADK